MKKLSLLFSLVFALFVSQAQTYLFEDFSSSGFPPDSWTIDGEAAQWESAATANAGGLAPEAQLTWKQTTSSTRLISPEVDLTGTSDVMISFRHFLDDYGGGDYTIGCATRSGGGEWNTVWEVDPTSDVGPELLFYPIDPADAGASDFQFCFYLEGNMYNFDYWFLDDLKLFTPFSVDAELTAIDLPSYVVPDDPFDVMGTVTNLGTDEITSFDVTYSIDGGEPQTTSFTGLGLGLGDTHSFTCDQPVSFTEAGSYDINVLVNNINGGGDDDNMDNNELMAMVGVVPFIPEKKVLGEEATGTWCTWCPRGTCYMNYMAETYHDTWIGVAVHNGDPMVVTEYDAAIPSIIPGFPGYPSGTVNRVKMWDPSEFEVGYEEEMARISPATCEITNFSWDPETRVVTFDVESEFVVDVANELRFMAIIVEDSLAGTSSDWAQVNAYSGGANGPMCGFEDLPSPVPASQMSYDHVAVAVLDSPYGTEGSLPETIAAGETHSYTYTYTMPDDADFYWTHFVGVLLDMETGYVLNCNSYPDEVTSIGDNTIDSDDIKLYPNPTTGIVHLTGVENANVSIYNITGKAVSQSANFSGNTIDLSDLQNGIYFINIQSEKGIITKKVSLSR